MFRKTIVSLGGLLVVATFLSVLAGYSLAGDTGTARAGTATETLQCADLDFAEEPGQACIALDPQTATNTVGDTHTITATISQVVDDNPVQPLADIPLYIFVIKGPNAGERVLGVSDANGQVALTYTGDGGAGSDMFGTEACLEGSNFCSAADGFIDSCVADPDPCVDTFFNDPTCDGSPGDEFICDNATKDWEAAQTAPSPTPQPTSAGDTAMPTALPSTGTGMSTQQGGVSGPWLIAALTLAAAAALGGAAWFAASRRRV